VGPRSGARQAQRMRIARQQQIQRAMAELDLRCGGERESKPATNKSRSWDSATKMGQISRTAACLHDWWPYGPLLCRRAQPVTQAGRVAAARPTSRTCRKLSRGQLRQPA